MEIIFLAVYGLLFALLVYRVEFLQILPTQKGLGVLFLGLKVGVGGLYSWFQYRQMGEANDAYTYFKGGMVLYRSLNEVGLGAYLRLVLGANDTHISPELFQYAYKNEFWGTDGSYTMTRFHAILRLISGGYYSVHCLFMSFAAYIGSLLYYKSLDNSTNASFWLKVGVSFLIPSCLFWNTGFHKDGIVFLGVGFVLFSLSAALKDGHWKGILGVLVGIGLVGIVRAFLLAALLPAIWGAVIYHYFPKHFVKIGMVCLMGGLVGIYVLDAIFHVPFFQTIANARLELINAGGNSRFSTEIIAATFQEHIQAIPMGLLNAFFRPFVTDSKGMVQLLTSLEPLVLLLSAFIVTVYRLKQFKASELFVFSMVLGIGILILLGWTVPNAGTLVRYRATAICVLIVGLLNGCFCQRERNS